jgi:hypothetical protein
MSMGQRRRLLDVGPGVAADPVRVALVHRVDLIAGDVLALGPAEGQPEVTRHRLEAVPGQVARREVVPQHGVERVDQLAPGRDQADPPPARAGRADGDAAPGPALAQPGRADPAQRQRHAERAGAGVEERQVEAVQVVVLDHVGVGPPHPRHQRGDERRLVGVLQDVDDAVGVTHGDEEDAVARRVEPGGLEVELQPAHVGQLEAAEVGPARRHQVLLLGRQQQRAVAEVTHVAEPLAVAPAGRAQHRAGERVDRRPAHHEAQLAGAVELAHREPGVGLGQATDVVDQHPRPEPGRLVHQRAVDPAPHVDQPIALGPHPDDARRRVPAPQPLVLARAGVGRIRAAVAAAGHAATLPHGRRACGFAAQAALVPDRDPSHTGV